MITKQDIRKAISELDSPSNFSDCAKLATFYTLLDHIDGADGQAGETTVKLNSGTEFAAAVNGMQSDTAWGIMEELMTMLQAVQPKIYNSVMARIARS